MVCSACESSVCCRSRRKGASVCRGIVHLDCATTEEKILAEFETRLLARDVLQPAVERAKAKLAHNTPDRGERQNERAQLVKELQNLTAAVAAGGDVPTLIAEIKKREARKAELDRLLAKPAVDSDGLRKALEARVSDWKRLLRSQPTHGNAVLRNLLGGSRIQVRPSEGGATWNAEGQLTVLLHMVGVPSGYRRELHRGNQGANRRLGRQPRLDELRQPQVGEQYHQQVADQKTVERLP